MEVEIVSALWAVDPTEARLHPSAPALGEARHFLGGAFTRVHPIYICPEKERSLEEVKAQMLEFLNPLNLGQTLPPDVYLSSSAKRVDWVDTILTLAHSQNDQLILLTSHGRSIVGAFLLGSFAHELLQKSDLPIFFMNSNQLKEKESDKVLFATDFSELSRMAFVKFMDFVKGKTSEVIICHILTFPPKPFAEDRSAIERKKSLPGYFVEYQKEWTAVEIEEWLSKVRKANVNIKFKNLVEESRASLSKAIEEVVDRENVSLVGVASHVVTVERILSRSVTEQLLSLQKFNLWVCGPQCFHIQTQKNLN